MLPFFAAAGHNLYAKSARIYLQKMLKLEATHPEVYANFSQVFTPSDAKIDTGLDCQQIKLLSKY